MFSLERFLFFMSFFSEDFFHSPFFGRIWFIKALSERVFCCIMILDFFTSQKALSDEALLKEFMFDLFTEKKIADNIHIGFGVFTNAGLETDMEERFERAGIAADIEIMMQRKFTDTAA